MAMRSAINWDAVAGENGESLALLNWTYRSGKAEAPV